MAEFDLIETFFNQQKQNRNDVIIGIGDDCAVTYIPHNQQLAITTDTLVSGVHFPENTSAYDIGYKSLAVNLSDLAAMGATPAWATLALTLPDENTAWLTEFSRGFFALANQYDMQLIGGDTTRGPLTITITAHGFLPKQHALLRSGAKPNDLIYVTNQLGDAGLALLFLQKKISLSPNNQNAALTKLNRPEPQIEMGIQLRDMANAAIDISDGLAADLGHVLEKSHVGATLYVDQIPLSSALRESLPIDDAITLALTAGDDYELCFTISPEKEKLLANTNGTYTKIGVITAATGLNLQFSDGRKYHGNTKGYQHF